MATIAIEAITAAMTGARDVVGLSGVGLLFMLFWRCSEFCARVGPERSHAWRAAE
jgi:hypothetical protein